MTLRAQPQLSVDLAIPYQGTCEVAEDESVQRKPACALPKFLILGYVSAHLLQYLAWRTATESKGCWQVGCREPASE